MPFPGAASTIWSSATGAAGNSSRPTSSSLFPTRFEGIIHNANYVDGSLYGIGRGPGNCCLELLMGFLKNPKFNLTPILKVIQDYMMPIRKDIEWGYIIPYLVTGILNEHPRSAIAYRKTEDRDKYDGFYEKMRLPQE